MYVALNYRIGALGWLAGSDVQADGVANAGFYDQRLALEWVQDNIHLFGGDKDRVTVMGESAGAGSILHQITAFGGEGRVPFGQAILQSPGYIPIPGNWQSEVNFNSFLTQLNVSTLQQARQLPSEMVVNASISRIMASKYASWTYGPVVDGIFTPATPQRLLLDGAFHKNVKLMVGHNSFEGREFRSPFVTNSSTFGAFIQSIFPTIPAGALNEVMNVLYPPIFDGSRGYATFAEAQQLMMGDLGLTCSTNSLSRAFGNLTYACMFY